MTILNWLSFLLILFGAFLILVAGVGILRMPDLFLRMSITTKVATLGIGVMMIATALFFGDLGVTARVLVTMSFVMATAPVSAHMIGRAAYSDGVPLTEETVVDELRDRYVTDQETLITSPQGEDDNSSLRRIRARREGREPLL